MTKSELLTAYGRALVAEFDWAKDQERLARFLFSASRTIRGTAATWNHDSEVIRRVWRELGGKGRVTLKALRALPEN